MRIEQDQEYKGEDWWNWSVWLNAPPAELKNVDKVIWRLHPTFVDHIRETTNRAEGFRLSTSGWGTFRLTADVHMTDGSVRKLQHDLELHYPYDGRPAQPYTTYTVKSGDTLGKIAKMHFGDANKYMTIFDLNKDQLSASRQDRIGTGAEDSSERLESRRSLSKERFPPNLLISCFPEKGSLNLRSSTGG